MEVLIPVFVSDYYPMTPETREMTLANDKGNSNSQIHIHVTGGEVMLDLALGLRH